ncbi:MAG: hypothetical protein ACOC4M_05585, partial [Promethearchaeia archaeon]
MKKIIYSLHLALVGSLNSGKHKLIDVLKSVALKHNRKENSQEFQILHRNILFKINVYSARSFSELGTIISNIEKLDGLITVINLYERKFFESGLKKKIEYLKRIIQFEDYKVLVATEQPFTERYKIRKKELIQKTKDLDFIYCFKLETQANEKDVLE